MGGWQGYRRLRFLRRERRDLALLAGCDEVEEVEATGWADGRFSVVSAGWPLEATSEDARRYASRAKRQSALRETPSRCASAEAAA